MAGVTSTPMEYLDTTLTRSQRSNTGASSESFGVGSQQSFQSTAVGLQYLPEPVALKPVTLQPALAEKFGRVGEMFTSRFVYRITKKGHRHRRVILINRHDIFLVDPEGLVRHKIPLEDITRGWVCMESDEVVLEVRDPQTNPSLYFEDIEHLAANEGMPRVADCLFALASVKLPVLRTRTREELRGKATFKKGEGYVSAREQLSKAYPHKTFAPSVDSDSGVSIDVDYNLEAMKRRMNYLAEENERLRTEVAVASSARGEPSSPSNYFDRSRASAVHIPRIHVCRDGATSPHASPNQPMESPSRRAVRELQETATSMAPSPRFIMLPLGDVNVAPAAAAGSVSPVSPSSPAVSPRPSSEGVGGGGGGGNVALEQANLQLEAEERSLKAELKQLRKERPSQQRLAMRQEVDAIRASMQGMIATVEGCQRRNAEMACTLLSAIVETPQVSGSPRGKPFKPLGGVGGKPLSATRNISTPSPQGGRSAATQLVQEALDRM